MIKQLTIAALLSVSQAQENLAGLTSEPSGPRGMLAPIKDKVASVYDYFMKAEDETEDSADTHTDHHSYERDMKSGAEHGHRKVDWKKVKARKAEWYAK